MYVVPTISYVIYNQFLFALVLLYTPFRRYPPRTFGLTPGLRCIFVSIRRFLSQISGRHLRDKDEDVTNTRDAEDTRGSSSPVQRLSGPPNSDGVKCIRMSVWYSVE